MYILRQVLLLRILDSVNPILAEHYDIGNFQLFAADLFQRLPLGLHADNTAAAGIASSFRVPGVPSHCLAY